MTYAELNQSVCELNSFATTVRSFGVLVWELASFGERPYDHMTDSDVIRSVFVERSADLAKPKFDFAFVDRLSVGKD